VIGSGIMGGGIAAIAAGAGSKVFLLDIPLKELTDKQKAAGYKLDDPNIRNLIARKGLLSAFNKKASLQLFYSFSDINNVTVGNVEDNFEEFVGQSDLIIEVVPEVLSIKNQTYERVDKCRQPDSIVASNTSGIPLKEMAKGRSDSFKQHFVLTHFFSPVRYMRLLEVAGIDETLPEVLGSITEYASESLGKGVVQCKDTPGFIGNRIGLHEVMTLLEQVDKYGLTAIDTVFGKHLGRGGKPLVTMDMAGLDTLDHVRENLDQNTNDERSEVMKHHPLLDRLIKEGRFGVKTKQGLYKKEGKKFLVINPETWEYEEQKKPDMPSIKEAIKADDPVEATRILYKADDLGGEIFRSIAHHSLAYAFNRIPEIADSIVDIDNAMMWGFNTKMGPGHILDAIGVDNWIEGATKAGLKIPAGIAALQKSGGKVYDEKGEDKTYFDTIAGKHVAIKVPSTNLSFENLKRKGALLEDGEGAGIYDLGDGILGAEIRTKNGLFTAELLHDLNLALDMVKDHEGLVISNPGDHFSMGANLQMVVGMSQWGRQDLIEMAADQFQTLGKRVRYCPKPVVVAKQGMALGGGTEIGLGGRIRVHRELYMGLVEVGPGLIPGGGGCVMMLKYFYDKARELKGDAVEPIDYIVPAFQLISNPRNVSRSARIAKELGLLRATDKITMDIDRLLYDAKKDVLGMAHNGYTPPEEVALELPGAEAKNMLEMGLRLFDESGFFSGYEHMIPACKELAFVLTGGDLAAPGRLITEDELLKLEREAFGRLGMSDLFPMVVFTILKQKDPVAFIEESKELTKSLVNEK